MPTSPPLVQTKVYKGTLTFGTATAQDVSCQVRNFEVTPSHSYGNTVVTLCGAETAAVLTTTWSAKGKVISDFGATAGFVHYCLNHHDTQQPFSFTPNGDAMTPTITGTCRVVALPFGGDVNADIELDFEFTMTAPPTVTYSPTTQSAGKAKG